MASPFQDEQPEWEGTIPQPSGSNTQFQAFPFTASSSDNVFAPISGGRFSQPQIFAPNSIPIDNNTAYNQLPNSPTVQPSRFVYDRPPHLPISPSHSPLQNIHPSHYRRLHFPFPNNNNNFTHTSAPDFRPFVPQVPQPPFYYNHHLYPQNPAPIQYVYLPAPLPVAPPLIAPDPLALPPASKSLPVLTSIPLLNIKSDFYAWDEGVATLLRHLGIQGHVMDPTLPVIPQRPDLSPSIRPLLSDPPSPAELSAFHRWAENDNVAQYVLVGRLGSLARQLLPSTDERTAFLMYKAICKYFGLRNFTDCAVLAASLRNLRCEPNKIQDFVARWRAGVSRLRSARFPFSVRVYITDFVDALPQTLAFSTLRALLPGQLDRMMDDNDLGAFIGVTNDAMDLEVAFRNSRQSSRGHASATTAPQAPSVPAKSASISSSSAVAVDSSTRTNRSSMYCNNCKSIGHIDLTCFKEGGGMAGRHEEYFNNKSRIHAMFAECLEDAFLNLPAPISESSDPHLPLDPHSSSVSPPPSLDDQIIVPTAAMCISGIATNPDLILDLYIPCDSKFPRFALTGSPDFQSSALISLVSLFNTLLDSGCTHHIIRDRSLFSDYVAKEISVGTANCGSLRALGTGDVSFRSSYGDRHILITLRGCLYAPDAPINLLSVGALVDRGMSALFTPGGVTRVSFPSDHPTFPDFSFSATVHHRLSFLNLHFVTPKASVSPTALSALTFPRVTLNSTLWHGRFGHIGMDATRAALTKDYVTGVTFEGPFVRDHCVACIIGKSPQHSYSHNGDQASRIGELLHMDLCGPYPVQAPGGELHFFNILDDYSNFGFTFGLRKKNDVFPHYLTTESFIERSNGVLVAAVRLDGALELTAGAMGGHFASKGIAVQKTAPHAHSQNGKSERYVRTLEEGGQTLLAASGLPVSFWLDAVLTSQYLRNRLPTSTLPANTTPFESFTRKKPDLSHLRVWGCQCFVAVPDELRPKAGFKRFEAVFVGYEENRVGWRVRDLHGKYHFSRDIIFNENSSGRLGVPRPISFPTDNSSTPSVRPTRIKTRTTAGKEFDAVIRLKDFRAAQRTMQQRSQAVDGALHGGADVVAATVGVVRLQEDLPPTDTIANFTSFLTPSLFPDQTETLLLEADVLRDYASRDLHFTDAVALRASSSSRDQSSPSSNVSQLSQAPFSYAEAISRTDASVWRAAMERELKSLSEMGAFEETDLPKGERVVGLKWVYAQKTDAEGVNIPGKEKARLVAQGFSQRPGQYDETYAPVAKMASVRILLTWAAVRDLEIFQFDCKTAFLHAKIRHAVYGRQIPGFPLTDPKKVLRILVALYGLRQSTFEFYTFLMSLLLALGMIRCEIDHGIFMGKWTSSPDSSVPMPLDGSPLVLYVPLHVDDGLAITNSPSLYQWFLTTLARQLTIVDLGQCSKFLSILIIRDRSARRLWLSSHIYVAELLEEWNLTSCRHSNMPFPPNVMDKSTAPSNALPDITDADIVPKYQRLVGCLLYLAIATRPDISFHVMWLGQFNACPTRSHFLTAKHVLRYLAGTPTLALCLGAPSSSVPPSLRSFMQNVGCSDADWASDASDRRSISSYSFYFEGSLVSWSAVKQKSIALSSTEAEYYAMTHAFKEALWIRGFLGLLEFPVPRPFPILSDNQAACALSNSPAISARSKHIDIRHHFIRSLVQEGSFSTIWIPTEDMPADIFTKSLPFITFSRHRDVLGLSVPFSSV